jgi:hypothetical protein
MKTSRDKLVEPAPYASSYLWITMLPPPIAVPSPLPPSRRVDLVVVADHIGVLVGVEVPGLGLPPPQATIASKVKPARAVKPGMVAVARNTGFLLQERGGA